MALTGTVLQLRQDVALLRDQMSNLVVSKEFAAVRIPKGIAEQQDKQLERRLDQIEQKMEDARK